MRMKSQMVMTTCLLALVLAAGCTSTGSKFNVLDTYPGPAEKMPVAGDVPAGSADSCRNDWVSIVRIRHHQSGSHDHIYADVTNCGTETIYVTISAEVAGPQHNWWTQAGGAFIPPGVEKRVSTSDERTDDHQFTGVGRFNARAGNAECGAWRYVQVVR